MTKNFTFSNRLLQASNDQEILEVDQKNHKPELTNEGKEFYNFDSKAKNPLKDSQISLPKKNHLLFQMSPSKDTKKQPNKRVELMVNTFQTHQMARQISQKYFKKSYIKIKRP